MNFKYFPRFSQFCRFSGGNRVIDAERIEGRVEDVLDVKYKNAHEFYQKTLSKNSEEIIFRQFSNVQFLEIDHVRTTDLLAAHPFLILENHALKDIENTVNLMNEHDVSIVDIMKQPRALLLNQLTFSNRLKVLQECSFNEMRLTFFYRFITIMNKPLCLLKAFDYVNQNTDVPKKLLTYLDIHIVLKEKIKEDQSLQHIRTIIINKYLQERLKMTDREIGKYWTVYKRLKHRSLQNIVEVIQLLDKISFGVDRIVKNGFILYSCPVNLKRMLEEIPMIGNRPITEVIFKRPKVAMQNVDTVKEILNHLKKFDIPEDYVLKCLDLLTLGSESVHERLRELTKVKEFNVLKGHPRVLRLIHYQNKARTRLEYLKQLKVKCASLHVLSSSSETFEKYARDGVDRTKGKDAVLFISKVLKMERDIVRETFSRHPNWCNVPLISIKNVLDYLKYKKFSEQDVRDNIHLLLYPVSRIEQKLVALMDWKLENDDNRKISGVSLSAISNSKLLTLCLYFIEQEFHFSGDGIWDVNRADMKQDLFPTTIPDFPKTLSKQYRYGTTSKFIEQQLKV